MLHTGHQTFPKRTDMTVSEQRELGLVIFYPMHGGGGILGGSHVFHREQRGVSVIANRV